MRLLPLFPSELNCLCVLYVHYYNTSLSLSFASFRDAVGKKVVKALKRKDDAITHAVVDFLCALMQPMHDNFDLRQEQMNKSSLLSSKAFIDTLLKELLLHIVSGDIPIPYLIVSPHLLVSTVHSN